MSASDYKVDVMRFLDAEGKQYETRDDNFILSYHDGDDEWVTVIMVNNDLEIICVYSALPENAPEDRRSAVCEFIARANYDLRIGNWEIDVRDGECRFKTSVDVEGSEGVSNLVKQLLRRNLYSFHQYAPGIRRVIAGGDPKECCDECDLAAAGAQ